MNSRKSFGRRGLDETQTKRNPVFINPTQNASALASSGPVQFRENEEISAGQLVITSLAFMFSFQGRISRRMYWYMYLLQFVLSFGISFPLFLNENINGNPDSTLPTGFVWVLPLYIALFVFGLSVTARRMHDRGVSAYWILSWGIPFVGIPICLVQTFKNMFFAGTPGRNRFGI
ncbi:DUF805 domain-containing protein [Roseibium sp.]|uniref:DUF805 domain-containing protein n=1 Tax=Roseibium sp. TaxID=1936156 RepID=UPI003B52332B